jgi:hypothetical protein
MYDRFTSTLGLSRLAKLVLPAAIAVFLALGTAPARAQDTNQATFQASYDGVFTTQLNDNGVLGIDAMMPGDATFLLGSTGFFSEYIDPTDPTTLNGVLVLFGGDNGTVYGTYQGTQTAPDFNGVMQIAGTFNIADGWMQDFGAATGTGTFSGTLNFATGEMNINFIGALAPATPTPD